VAEYATATAVAEFGMLPAEPDTVAPVTEPALRGESGGDAYWRNKLTIGRDGPTPNLSNVLYILRRAPEWHGVFRFNSFAQRVVVYRQPPYQAGLPTPREIHDSDLTFTAVWMQDQGLKDVSPEKCQNAIAAVAQDYRYSPLLDYLSVLRHDSTARIDTWVSDYLGAADTPLNRAIGARFLISAVARAFEPGCQVDTMPAFEGPQGMKKSTALRVLFGSEWFTDHIPDLHSKDAALQIQGIWCLEHAEMATLNRTDANRVKEFISRRVDRFRPVFGKTTMDHPRQGVFAATLNPNGSGYLKDETGARRFWPVACGTAWPAGQRIDVAALATVRDQLWAEATVRYRRGEPWWLDTLELEAAQIEATEARFDADVWTDNVAEIVADKPFVRVAEIFDGLHIPVGDRTKPAQMRIGGILRALGWSRKLQRIDGSVARTFVPPATTAARAPSKPISLRDDLAAFGR
jgi:predicted P-loop ATPase